MAIKLGTTPINTKYLGAMPQNKIMLGVIEIFPNIGTQPPGSFSPSDWFVNGEEGLFYNFNDNSFEGLVLGAQANPQVDFNASAGWTVGSNMVISGGALRADTVWAAGQSSFAATLMAGRTYLVEVVVSEFLGAGQFNIGMGNTPSEAGRLRITGVGTFRAILQNDGISAPSRLAVNNSFGTGMTIAIDSLSCIEVLSGYHPVLLQNSTANGQAAGAPVSIGGQLIGWAKDLKRPAGPQLIQDANYANLPGAWSLVSCTASAVDGLLTITNTAAARGMLVQSFPTEIGKQYLVDLGELNDGTGGTLNQNANVRVGAANDYPGANLVIVGTPQSHGYATFVATSTTSWLFLAVFSAAIGATAIFGTMTIGEWDGRQAFQVTGTARPQYNTVGSAMGAIADGVDDCLLTVPIDFSATPIITVMAVILRNTNSRGMAYEFTSNATNGQAGSFGLRAPENAAQQWRFEIGSQGVSQFKSTTTTYVTPQLAVSTCVYDGSFVTADERLMFTLNDLVVPSAPGGANGSGQAGFANDILYIGRRGGANTPANMSLGALVLIGRELTAAEITEGVNYFKGIFGAMEP